MDPYPEWKQLILEGAPWAEADAYFGGISAPTDVEAAREARAPLKRFKQSAVLVTPSLDLNLAASFGHDGKLNALHSLCVLVARAAEDSDHR